jgi:beta-glucosidase-like glycosyl hydrolase/4-amino-4-deoxy-L-arabinose transferase-like glycosyltransferase
MFDKMRNFIKSKYFLPILVVIITFLTHGINLWGYPSFADDEGTYTSQAWWLVKFGKLAPYTYWYDHPPFGWFQIGLWQILTGGPFTFDFSLFSTRIFMVLVALATNLMIYLLTLSLTKSRNLAILASVFFAFSPLCIFYHRRVLLDNLATFWFLASLYLLWRKEYRLSQFWLSGLVFGLSFLSKEVVIVFMPVMIYTLYLKSRPENRRFCLFVWLMSGFFLISLFPLLALLRNEFFPASWFSGSEHVSLLETIIFQAKRGSPLKPWQEASDLRIALNHWNKIDFLGMGFGLLAILINLVIGRKNSSSQVFALLSLSFLLFLARGGLVLDFYIIPLLSLFAINIALAVKVCASTWPWVSCLTSSKATIPVICFLAFLLVAQHPQVFREKATASQLSAVSFGKEIIPKDAFVAIDDFALIDFRLDPSDEKGFSNVEWFAKIENDPEIREKKLGNNWENIEYILLSQAVLDSLRAGKLPFLGQAFNHSVLVRDFPPTSDIMPNLEDRETLSGDWAALLKVVPTLREKRLADAYFGDLLPAAVDLSMPTETVDKLSLEEKIGQLFFVGFPGTELSGETRSFFTQHNIGGAVLFRENIKDREQLAQLVGSLQNVAKNTASGWPLFVAIDQEGGQVERVDLPEVEGISQEEIKSIEQAYLMAKSKGEGLRRLGILVNFSPVLDVVRDSSSYISITRRAFGGDETWVGQFGAAVISGYQEVGILSVPKHYPGGLGRTTINPHQKLPVIDIEKGELEKDLVPFSQAIKAEVPALMVSHLLYPEIDEAFPTSLSPRFITDILREDLDFKGLIIVDDIQMSSLRQWYTIEEIAQYAFAAGGDMFIVSGSREDQVRAINALVEAVRSGTINEERLNQSVKRVLELKEKYLRKTYEEELLAQEKW